MFRFIILILACSAYAEYNIEFEHNRDIPVPAYSATTVSIDSQIIATTAVPVGEKIYVSLYGINLHLVEYIGITETKNCDIAKRESFILNSKSKISFETILEKKYQTYTICLYPKNNSGGLRFFLCSSAECSITSMKPSSKWWKCMIVGGILCLIF